jgi:hypothetical protein
VENMFGSGAALGHMAVAAEVELWMCTSIAGVEVVAAAKGADTVLDYRLDVDLGDKSVLDKAYMSQVAGTMQ